MNSDGLAPEVVQKTLDRWIEELNWIKIKYGSYGVEWPKWILNQYKNEVDEALYNIHECKDLLNQD